MAPQSSEKPAVSNDKRAIEKELQSSTGLAYNSMLFDWMFIEKVIEARQKEFEAKYKAYMASLEKQYTSLNDENRKKLSERFVREYFDVEYDALAKYNTLVKEHDSLISVDEKSRTLEQRNRLKHITPYVNMGPEGYVTKAFFEPESVRRFKIDYKPILDDLRSERERVKNAYFSDVDSRVAFRPATIKMFNDSHPSLIGEMKKLASSSVPSKKEIGRHAMTALTVASAAATGGTSLMIKAAIGFAGSKSMEPVRQNIAKNLDILADKSGLKPYAKEKFNKITGTKVGRIAVGLGIGAVGVLTFATVAPDMSADIIASVKGLIADGANAERALAETMTDMDRALSETPPESNAKPEPQNSASATPETKVAPVEVPDPQSGQSAVPENNVGPEIQSEPQIGDVVKHTVVSGDTLSEIVEDHLKAQGVPYTYNTIEDMYLVVAQMNNIPDPHDIKPPLLIELPVIGNIPKDVDAVRVLQEKMEMVSGMASVVEDPKPSPELEQPKQGLFARLKA